MAVNALATRPNPPNNNLVRSLWVWITAQASQDPLDMDSDQQALLTFCGANEINVLYLDIFRYLGSTNGSTHKTARMRQFVDAAHKSGIRVYALGGNIDWGVNHQWVMSNIVEQIVAYQVMCPQKTQQFDGFMLDVEYWQDPANNPAATNLPGLCDLIQAIRSRADGLPVGCFAAFYLAGPERTAITYNGSTKVDGYHLMDVANFVVVGAYRNHAQDLAGAPGQITLFQRWYDYASQPGKNIGLQCGSETINAQANITYYGSTKALMEAQHALIATAFVSNTNSVFMGQSVHNYDGYRVMP
jgi:hypothetical protein